MRKLVDAIKRARKEGVQISDDLERGLYAKARTLKRRDRDRIKNGSITDERAHLESERAAVDLLLEKVNEDMEALNG